MFILIYINKKLIYLLIYCTFKILLYISGSNFYSSFLPILYLISISKLFAFILYKFQTVIMKKIQSIENNNNNNIYHEIINEEQLINPPQNLNMNGREMYIYNLRRKLIFIFFIICSSILEVIFYASFNKIYENDLIGNKRAYYYLVNNKLCFLLELTFIYLIFHKKYNNIHNILSLFLILISQIIIYILNYEENDKNIMLLLYSFFMNIIYSSQNYIEKEFNKGNNNNQKVSPMVIMGSEGIFELILVIIFNIGVKWYFGKNPISYYLIDMSISIKCIFMMLCILLSEYIRIETLNKYNPFYICFYEEIIYIFFSMYNYPSTEINYLFFHIFIILSIFIFIEVIELNFCDLNHYTERYLRQREFGDINDILEGIENISSLSTGSHSKSENENNNRNNDLINEDIFNFNINNNNEINIISGNLGNNEDINEDNKDISEDNKNKINIGKLSDEDEESYDDGQKNVFSSNSNI